ncbi:hypothetical protein HNQ07_003960 [Deinococcus metalli]|nr:hypothetical protein [Deinococcus metalli]MBB5378453.1 hypothetical protein [Deinococcus metalli]
MPDPHAIQLTVGPVETFPEAGHLQLTEVGIHRLPQWNIVKSAAHHPTAQRVQPGIDDLMA